MKKHALTVAVAGALGALSAQSAIVSEFSNGVLVPYAEWDRAEGIDTAVGLTSCAGGVVYWAFFDVNTKNIFDAQFGMTPNDQESFLLSTRLGGNFEGKPGYLVFVLDSNRDAGFPASIQALDVSDSPCLAGSAFQTRFADQDVAFIPALPLSAAASDFGPADANGIYVPNLITFGSGRSDGNDDLISAVAGAQGNETLYMRYFIDGAPGGNDTKIYIWSSENISGDNSVRSDIPGEFKVQIYDTTQQRVSASMYLPNDELNIIDPENPDLDLEATDPEGSFLLDVFPFDDGFVQWRLSDSRTDGSTVGGAVLDEGGSITSFSIISSEAVGAVQTIVNPH